MFVFYKMQGKTKFAVANDDRLALNVKRPSLENIFLKSNFSSQNVHGMNIMCSKGTLIIGAHCVGILFIICGIVVSQEMRHDDIFISVNIRNYSFVSD